MQKKNSYRKMLQKVWQVHDICEEIQIKRQLCIFLDEINFWQDIYMRLLHLNKIQPCSMFKIVSHKNENIQTYYTLHEQTTPCSAIDSIITLTTV